MVSIIKSIKLIQNSRVQRSSMSNSLGKKTKDNAVNNQILLILILIYNKKKFKRVKKLKLKIKIKIKIKLFKKIKKNLAKYIMLLQSKFKSKYNLKNHFRTIIVIYGKLTINYNSRSRNYNKMINKVNKTNQMVKCKRDKYNFMKNIILGNIILF